MPSNYTENYSLNQWSNNDQIKMEDFNADNQKIDAALGKLGRSEEFSFIQPIPGGFSVCSSTLPETWEKWEYLTAVLRFTDVGTPFTFKLSLNSEAGECCGFTLPSKSLAVVLCPRHNPDRKVSGILLCQEPEFFNCDIAYRQLTTLSLTRVTGTTVSPLWFYVGTL